MHEVGNADRSSHLDKASDKQRASLFGGQGYPILPVLDYFRITSFLGNRIHPDFQFKLIMPRSTKPSGKSRHDPLHVQLDDDELHAKYGRISKPGKRKKSRKSQTEDEENGEVSVIVVSNPLRTLNVQEQVILDPKTSRRIFELAKDQQEELGMPDDDEIDPGNTAFSAPRSQSLDEDDEDDEDEDREVGMDADEDVEQMLVCAPCLSLRSVNGLFFSLSVRTLMQATWIHLMLYYLKMLASEKRWQI